MAKVALEGVSRVHDDGTRAVSGLSVVVSDGELLILLGPSGCGKTTTLRLVAGLEPVSEGLISIAGRVVNDLPPGQRDVALLAQEHLLYPHLTAAGNLGFALRCHGVDRAETERQVRAHARALGIVRLLRRRPPTLSEGERQAVAFGRATTRRPLVYLLDEPLSGLDSAQRGRVRAEFARVRSLLRVTTLYVTADPLEAMAIGDRLAVLRDGVLQQVGPPRELYERPATLFLAGFLGTPGISALLGTLEVGARSAYLSIGRQRLPFTVAPPSMLREADGRTVVVGIRPEHVHLVANRPALADRRLPAAVERVEHLGASTLVHTRVEAPPAPRAALGAGPGAGWGAGPGAPLVARLDPGFSARPGEVVDLVIDTDRTLLFDPVNGVAVWHGQRGGWA